MPKLTVAVPHQLDQAAATERLQGILAKLKERYEGQVSDLHEEWQGNVLNFAFKTFGFNVKGAMHVEPQQVRVDGDLPFAAMMFKGKIEQELKNNLTRWLT
ncbi:MAG TPA: polyhydroxyalkanoic acid system family protein [Pirellulales bacterium]|jgi:putative polyhydroxyalkanoate system protein|nr:polyhydroxyalkanoic acid system family protein [Pirellulales bacterium]